MKKRQLAILITALILSFLPVGSRYQTVDLTSVLQRPSSVHVMGTDELGRDVCRRIAEGTALTVRISLLAWCAAFVLGLLLGTMAGYFSGKAVDLVISWFISLAYMTPFMVFLISLLGIIGPGLGNAYLILVLLAWAAPARQTRVAVKNLKHERSLLAGRSFGFTWRQTYQYVVFPQVFKPALIASLASLPEILALDAGLSFLGLGAQPPTPTLGKMIADGIGYIQIAWWMALFPAVVLVIVCLFFRSMICRTVPL
jgi:peptide/nickel transport system permease protein